MIGSTIDEQLRDFFRRHAYDLVCAYLFGSTARGNARSDSDIDIAVLYSGESPAGLAGLGSGLAGAIEREFKRSVDLVVLNRAPVDLIHRILRDGILILERDPEARIQFEVQARNAYFDLKPILDRYRRVPGNRNYG